jgi:hypothetical protein
VDGICGGVFLGVSGDPKQRRSFHRSKRVPVDSALGKVLNTDGFLRPVRFGRLADKAQG